MVKLRYLLVEVQKNCQKEEVNITVQIKKTRCLHEKESQISVHSKNNKQDIYNINVKPMMYLICLYEKESPDFHQFKGNPGIWLI